MWANYVIVYLKISFIRAVTEQSKPGPLKEISKRSLMV